MVLGLVWSTCIIDGYNRGQSTMVSSCARAQSLTSIQTSQRLAIVLLWLSPKVIVCATKLHRPNTCGYVTLCTNNAYRKLIDITHWVSTRLWHKMVFPFFVFSMISWHDFPSKLLHCTIKTVEQLGETAGKEQLVKLALFTNCICTCCTSCICKNMFLHFRVLLLVTYYIITLTYNS